jgi:phage gp45-like
MKHKLLLFLFAFIATVPTVDANVITLTTQKDIGETIALQIIANGNVNISGVSSGTYASNVNVYYTLASQTVTITGDVAVLSCPHNYITSLDVTGDTALVSLQCADNGLTSLDVSHNAALYFLQCSKNALKDIDLSHNTALNYLFGDENHFTALDLTNNAALISLTCRTNRLKTLDLSGNIALLNASCSDNEITELNVRNDTALTNLDCSYNQLHELILPDNIKLQTLYCQCNTIVNDRMDVLIGTIVDRSGLDAGKLVVFNPDGDNNVCTTDQVAAAAAKNWKVYYRNNSSNEDLYAGSPAGVTTVNSDNDAYITGIYDMSGRSLSTLQRGVNIVVMSNGKVLKKIY